MLHSSSHRPSLCSTLHPELPLHSDYAGSDSSCTQHHLLPADHRPPIVSHSPAVTAPVTAPYQLPALTYTEELRVHAVKVGHEDEANGSGGIEEEQEASREVKEKPTPVYHQQACQLLRQH